MTVTLTREEIAAIVKEAVIAAIADHPCRYDLKPSELEHMKGMMIDVGDGELRRGIEQCRKGHIWLIERIDEKDPEYAENHRMMTKLRKRIELMGGWAAKAIVLFILGVLLYFFGRGIGVPMPNPLNSGGN